MRLEAKKYLHDIQQAAALVAEFTVGKRLADASSPWRAAAYKGRGGRAGVTKRESYRALITAPSFPHLPEPPVDLSVSRPQAPTTSSAGSRTSACYARASATRAASTPTCGCSRIQRRRGRDQATARPVAAEPQAEGGKLDA